MMPPLSLALAGGAPPPETAGSILEAAELLLGTAPTTARAVPGLTINGLNVGPYHYTRRGSTVIDPFDSAAWFHPDNDLSAWIAIKGNLTIPVGVTVQPDPRKLFTVVVVSGDLTNNGALSVSQRGANHSASGSNIAAGNLRIATGTFSSVSNPQVPSTGGGGASSRCFSGSGNQSGNGFSGGNGSNGGTGGGGSGASRKTTSVATTVCSGAGAAGRSFGGGAAGGGISQGATQTGEPAEANGGKGGEGNSDATGGGAGNPGGAAGHHSTEPGGNGTGGVLIVVCFGVISGSGSVVANGAPGGHGGAGAGGAGAGAGSITILYGTDSSSWTLQAAGGSGGGGDRSGGSGGSGTARKLAL